MNGHAADQPLNAFARLLIKLLDGRLSEQEGAELRQALRDPRAREAYVQYMEVHTLLEWRFATSGRGGIESGIFPAGDHNDVDGDPLLGGAAARGMAAADAEDSLHGQDALHGFRISPYLEPDEPEPLPAPPTYTRPPEPRPNWWVRHWLPMTAAAAAAVLVFGLVLTVVLLMTERTARTPLAMRPPVPPAPPVAVVTVTAVVGAQWDDAALLAAPGTGLVAGTRLTLSQGLVELTFAGGARVILEAPASFVIDSGAAVSLDSGRLAARAAGEAAGFAVRTPDALVVDIGTEFGVAVDPTAAATTGGATQVQVFAGEVQATPNAPIAPDSPGPTTLPTPTVLKAGDLAQVTPTSVAVTPDAASPQAFVRRIASPATVLDVVDLICGGEGMTKRRNLAIDENTGQTGKLKPVDRKDSADRGYQRVRGLPVVDGCFIPDGRKGPTTIDSTGRTFQFPPTENRTYNHIWAGTEVPWPQDFEQEYLYKLGGVDYSQDGHALLFLHPNKGITLDLDAIRRSHPGKTPTRFRAVFGNSVPKDVLRAEPASKAQLYVIVDGIERDGPRRIKALEAPINLDVTLQPNDRFLTLVVTDGEDSPSYDWTIFGDPIFELGTP